MNFYEFVTIDQTNHNKVKILIDVNKIQFVSPHPQGSQIQFDDGITSFIVEEKYENITSMLVYINRGGNIK